MKNRVIYQIFPERFCNGNKDNDPAGIKPWGSSVDRECFMGGDIDGIITKLDYIKELGADAIYLNPIFYAASNHKYDTIDYYRIDPMFGDLDTFDKLIAESHARGIKIIIDGVFNHTNPDFFAFKDILEKQERSEYVDWYEIFSFPVEIKDPPPYRACGGASFLPKLRTDNPEVIKYFVEVMKYWEARGIDGIRLDVPFEIAEEMLSAIRKSTQLYIVGEIWGTGAPFVPQYFDGVTNYLLRDLIKKAVVNQCITNKMFADEWKCIESLYEDNIYMNVNLCGSHDTERILTMCGGNIKKAKLFFLMIFVMPGIPLVYYGDEIGMEGENDPYCRKCMEWDERKWNTDIRNHIKMLINIRKNKRALTDGVVEIACMNDRVIKITRSNSSEFVEIIVNFGFQKERIEGIDIEPLEFYII